MKTVIVCSVIVEKDNKYLFIKETKPSAKGKYGLPGGQLEEDENLEECAKREFYEETGFTLSKIRIFRIIHKPKTHEGNNVLKFVFKGEIDNKSTKNVSEFEAEWLDIDVAKDLDRKNCIRGKEIVGLLQDFKKSKTDVQILNF